MGPLTRLVVSDGWQMGSLDWSVVLMMLPGVERKKDRDGEMKERIGLGVSSCLFFLQKR